MNDVSRSLAALADATIDSILDAQVAALLQRIGRERDRRCRQLRETAELQAREIVRTARHEARTHVHQAVVQERQRIEQSLRQAEAGVAMQERQRQEHNARHLLTEMWQALPALLDRRWREAPSRQAWIEAAIRQATRVLSHREWRIEYGEDLASDEARMLIERACAATGTRWSLALDASLGAGIRVRAGAACLDATVAGLLAERGEIEAAFLAQYERDEAAAPAEAAP
jgi:hypothetical protein